MSEPFISEIKMFGFDWAPRGWAKCDGQLLPIDQNQVLFSLLGTNFGGDGYTSFGLPDLRGRAPMHANNGKSTIGMKGGAETVTLDESQIPNHGHRVRATTSNANTNNFQGSILAAGFDKRALQQKPLDMYGPAEELTCLHSDSITSAGSSGQSHNNIQPSCVLNFCIALKGDFPQRD